MINNLYPAKQVSFILNLFVINDSKGHWRVKILNYPLLSRGKKIRYIILASYKDSIYLIENIFNFYYILSLRIVI